MCIEIVFFVLKIQERARALLALGYKGTRADIESLLAELSSSSSSTDEATLENLSSSSFSSSSASSSSSSEVGLPVNVPEAGRLRAMLERTQALGDRIHARMSLCDEATNPTIAAAAAATTIAAASGIVSGGVGVDGDAIMQDADADVPVSSNKLTLKEMQELVDEVSPHISNICIELS
jgi:hypothetical protein